MVLSNENNCDVETLSPTATSSFKLDVPHLSAKLPVSAEIAVHEHL